MISKPIMDVSVPEKEKVTFDCEVSRTNTEVKWFKVRNHYEGIRLHHAGIEKKIISSAG